MSKTGQDSEDVAAALGARRELGPDYEDAIAESLADRFEKKIEARIAARLGTAPGTPQAGNANGDAPGDQVASVQAPHAMPGYPPAPHRPSPYYPVPSSGNVVPVVSLIAGIPISAIIGGTSHGSVAAIAVTWVGIAAVNLAHAWGRKRRP
jgi:hypothetical protein